MKKETIFKVDCVVWKKEKVEGSPVAMEFRNKGLQTSFHFLPALVSIWSLSTATVLFTDEDGSLFTLTRS